jgi:nicotinamidase/pyrazinamidase
MAIALKYHDVLVAVDVQYDFLPGGSLAVAGGDEIIPMINAIGSKFQHVVMTQDWHPANHISFASSYVDAKPFEVITVPYGPQVLWPDHCVWDTHGAQFHADLHLPQAQLIIRKGYRETVDSYSGFQEADRQTKTGLEGYLKERGLKRLFIAGLATDFCVHWTAIDARAAGFEVFVIEDACRGIDTGGSLEKAWADMDAAGVHRISALDFD